MFFYSEADLNNDGKLDYDEFIKIMTSYWICRLSTQRDATTYYIYYISTSKCTISILILPYLKPGKMERIPRNTENCIQFFWCHEKGNRYIHVLKLACLSNEAKQNSRWVPISHQKYVREHWEGCNQQININATIKIALKTIFRSLGHIFPNGKFTSTFQNSLNYQASINLHFSLSAYVNFE